MYGSKTDNIEMRWRRACEIYLQFVFNGAPDQAIRAAAREVFRYSPTWVLKAETVH